MTATVQEIPSKIVGKWTTLQPPNPGTLFQTGVPPALGNTSVENDTLSSSDDEPSEVEILSPPRRRPVTRSVSAKRVADEMEAEDPLLSPTSLPPAKKARRGAPGKSTFLGSPHSTGYGTNIFTETGTIVEPLLFEAPSSPEILEFSTTPDTASPPRPNENYLLLENPWSEKISYF